MRGFLLVPNDFQLVKWNNFLYTKRKKPDSKYRIGLPNLYERTSTIYLWKN